MSMVISYKIVPSGVKYSLVSIGALLTPSIDYTTHWYDK